MGLMIADWRLQIAYLRLPGESYFFEVSVIELQSAICKRKMLLEGLVICILAYLLNR